MIALEPVALVPKTSVDDVFRMQAHRHVLAVADVAEDDGEMLHRVPGQRVGVGLRLAAGRLDVGAGDALDQRFLALAIGDEVGDRDLLQPVLLGKGRDLRAALDGAVVIDEFARSRRSAAGRRACRDRRPLRYGPSASARRLRARSAGRCGRGGRNRRRRHCGLARLRTVSVRSSAEMPVVVPCLKSTRDGEGGRVGANRCRRPSA